MVRVKAGEEVIQNDLRLKVRFDYKSNYRKKGLFNNKNPEKYAIENRDQQVALLRNVPIQGIRIEDINMDGDIYTTLDIITNEETIYAPVEFTISSDCIEDILRFIMREEFRCIQIIEPEQMLLSKQELERALFKMNEEMKLNLLSFWRKINGK